MQECSEHFVYAKICIKTSMFLYVHKEGTERKKNTRKS